MQAINNRFIEHANDGIRILSEDIKDKAKTDKSYEPIHDYLLAKFLLFDHLSDQSYLSSREAFLTELEAFVNRIHTGTDAYDKELCKKFMQNYVLELIDEFSEES